MTQIAYTVALRFFQVFESAGPTLVLGVLVAAALRSMVRPEAIRRFFDAGSFGSVFRAILVAAMLPVGALGALPIAMEFRRVRISTPALVAFVVAAPLLNPLAFAYALTSLAGATILWTVAAAVAVCLAVPVSLHGSTPKESGAESPRTIASSAGRRVTNLAVATARICSGALAGYVLLAAAVTGVAAACFDGHGLIHGLNPGNPLATLLMTAAAIFVYVSPAGGITLMHGMAAMRLSVGACIAAYVFGVGQNAGLLVWTGKVVGFRRLLAFLLLSIGLVFAIGLTADAQFRHHSTGLAHSGQGHHHESEPEHAHDHGHEQGDSGCGCGGDEHNHALDALGRWETAAYRSPIWEAFRFSKPSQLAASILLAVLCAIGVVLRLAGVDERGLPEPVSESPASDNAGGVSSRRILIIAVAYFCVMSALGVYIYFPPTKELFTQMTFHRANAILATKHNKCDYAIRELDAWDALAAKCTMSATLRGSRPGDEQREFVAELREALARLREAIVQGRSDEEKQQLSADVMETYSRCRKGFAGR